MTTGMDWLVPGWLTTLLAVARHRNFTRAAEELFLTQPAVSRQMRALQQAVGVPLVEQLGKTLELTDAGRALVREAERIQAGIARAAEVVAAVRGGREGRLRIGASTTPGYYLLPRVLAAFLARRPATELAYVVGNTLKIEELLLRNELDLGFVGGHLASGELASEPLVEDRVVVYAGRSHPLAKRRRVVPERLVECTFVVRERGSATRQLFERWLAKRGLRLGRQIELDCPEAIKTLVAAGVGIAVSSCHGLESTRSRFKILSVPGLDIERRILVVRHADKRLLPLHDEFLTAVRQGIRPCTE